MIWLIIGSPWLALLILIFWDATARSDEAWWFRQPEAIDRFTGWLVVWTALLFLATIVSAGVLFKTDLTLHETLEETRKAATAATVSAEAAKQSAEVADATLKATQRPFVFRSRFESTVLGRILRVHGIWENSGATGTRDMRSRASWRWFASAPPFDFAYPDLDARGMPNLTSEAGPAFVGPRSTSLTVALDVPLELVDRVRAGNGRILVWGWAEYSDGFEGTRRYRTEFCNELQVLGISVNETDPKTVQAAISFPIFGRFNSAN